MGDYYKYTDAEIDTARQTDMIDFLEQNEGFTFKKAGNEWHCIQHDSLVIMSDRKGFAWNSKDICGSNVIAYCQKVKNMSFIETLQMLVGQGSQSYVKTAKIEKPKEKLPLELPPRAHDCKRAFAYLSKTRGIDDNIISALMHDKKIYQDSHNNVVFVEFNEANKPAFACRRGTFTDNRNPPFRGDCTNSDKNYGFTLEGRKKSKVFVFESPIDLLSHATLANLATGNSEAWKLHNRVALSGKSDNALEHYLKKHPDIKEIAICLDNDIDGKDNNGNPCNHGQVTAKKIIEKYSKLGYNMINMPPSQGKDYNENLKIIQKSLESKNAEVQELPLSKEHQMER